MIALDICEIQCILQVAFASSIKLTMALKFLKKNPYHPTLSSRYLHEQQQQ